MKRLWLCCVLVLAGSARDAALYFAPGEWTSHGPLNELVSAGSMNSGALESLVLLRFVGIQNASVCVLQTQVSMIMVLSTERLVHAAHLQLCSTEIRHGSSVQTT